MTWWIYSTTHELSNELCIAGMFVHVCSCCRRMLEQVEDKTIQGLQTPPPEEEEEEEGLLSLSQATPTDDERNPVTSRK